MIIEIKYNTLGVNTGPLFTITCDVGNAVPQVVTKAQLLAGVLITVSDLANQFIVASQGECSAYDVLYLNTTTTTSTTSSTTTTSTTTTSTTTTTTTTEIVYYYNVYMSQDFTRDDCEVGYFGSTVTYIVPAYKYVSTISQADADQMAQDEIDANGQIFANTYGSCDSTTTTTTTSTTTTSTTTTSTTTTELTTTTTSTTTTTTTTTTSSTTTTTTTAYVPQCTPLDGIASAVYTVDCGNPSSYSGGQSYPAEQDILLGSSTGTVTLNANAYSVPDQFIVIFAGNIVINTGYRGDSTYDFGGASRTSFNNSLTGKVDPVNGGTYPNFTNFPDDGYPRVTSPGSASPTFSKLTSALTATVRVYGPMPGTAWTYTLSCPV